MPTVAELTARARDQWRAALVARAGDSALAHVDRLGDAQLDLSAAHPSGIAQLFAGRPTRLSNLVREGSALSAAKRRARAVGALAEDHAQRHGLASAFLAIGVATWTEQPRDDVPADAGEPGGVRPDHMVRAPVLLRPVAVDPRGRGESDYDLALEPSAEVNPVLAAALRRRGALLDPTALARGTFTAGGFDPAAALDRLRALGAAVLDGFELEDCLLVGTFLHPEQVLVDDIDAQASVLHQHEVLAALAGHTPAVNALAHPLPARVTGDRPPDQERGVGDLDAHQTHVLEALAAGHHLVVDAPPGSDVAGTVAAVVADAAAAGRTVLYVAGHRRAALALRDRLTAHGLGDLVLDVAPESDWRSQAARSLLGAMTVEPVPVDAEKIQIVQRELADRRTRLEGYVAGLHTAREPWGTSAYDALQALARLTSVRPAPRTRIRLTAAVAESLDDERRAQAATDLVRAAALGAFTITARDTPWFGADILTPDRAATVMRRIERLLDTSLPRLTEQVTEVAEDTGLTPAASPAEWAEQLEMLAGVRAALDIFRPVVFERSAADLVAATATRGWRAEHGVAMSQVLRRRLHKQAKDMVRPGRPVADLHTALVEVQAQREVWQAHCPAGGWPRIPEGMASIEADHRAVREDLESLSAVLAGTAGGGDLERLGWAELTERLRRLRQDPLALQTLPERTALVRSLDRRGLGALLEDLADRRVAASMVAAELDLAWWSTVFDQILGQDPALAGYDGATLARLSAEFRALDRRHLSDHAVVMLATVREGLRRRLRTHAEQSEGLFADIVENRFTSLRQSVERYPDVTRALRPCLIASPMLVPHLLPPTRTEDLVILDAAAHLPTEVVVSAIARGRQVLVVGDTRSASGSAFRSLADVLPSLPLHVDGSRRDPHLTAFLAAHGYAERLTATPLPTAAPLLRLELVEGTGMPAPSGVVEGTRAEVERVVDLVIDHALTRPEESLAVVTVSAVHAERLREAVMAEVRDNPALGIFFRPDRGEPFVVAEVGATQGLTRDAVILSVGFGRTPHGRVLHRFGSVSEAGGERRLLEALGATRRRLTVVSCFRAEELDKDRLRAPGAQLLAELLEVAERRSASSGHVDRKAPAPSGRSTDRLLLDLAERLWRLGLLVDLDHGVPGGPRIPLVVGHQDLADEMLVAVLTDDAAYVGEPSIRVRDRQRAERLEDLGWSVVQLWSAALFLDPQGEADAIAATVAAEAERRKGFREAQRRGTTQRMSTHEAAGGEPDAVEPAGDDIARVEPAAVEPGTVEPRTVEPRTVDAAGSEPATGTSSQVDDVREAPTAEIPPARDSADDDQASPPLTTSAATSARESRSERPAVEPGLPIGAYSDDQLDDLVAWIGSDGVNRTDDEIARALLGALGITRRGVRVDAAVRGAVRRARSGR